MSMDVRLHTIYFLLRVLLINTTEKMWLVCQCLVHWLILFFAILQLKLLLSNV